MRAIMSISQLYLPKTSTVEYNFILSANIAIWELFTESGRSFTCVRNRGGPWIDPCGTPDDIGGVFKVAPSIVTRSIKSLYHIEINCTYLSFVVHSLTNTKIRDFQIRSTRNLLYAQAMILPIFVICDIVSV